MCIYSEYKANLDSLRLQTEGSTKIEEAMLQSGGGLKAPPAERDQDGTR